MAGDVFSEADFYIGFKMEECSHNGLRLYTREYRPANGRKSTF